MTQSTEDKQVNDEVNESPVTEVKSVENNRTEDTSADTSKNAVSSNDEVDYGDASKVPNIHKADGLKRAPLDERSLMWRYGADSRIQLLRGYTGIMQNMHPAIGQALLDHSKFFDEPFARLERSTPQIIESIFSDENDPLPHRIRDYHKHIKGTLPNGKPYHSMNPEIYYWAHATFVYRIIYMMDLFGTPFTPEEREQIVQEGVTWWEKYGMSDRPVVDTYQGLVDLIKETRETVLECNPTIDFALRTVLHEQVKRPDGVSQKVWDVIWKPVMRFAVWSTIGTLEPEDRKIVKAEWTAKDQALFTVFRQAVKFIHPRLPTKMRFMEPGRSILVKKGLITL